MIKLKNIISEGIKENLTIELLKNTIKGSKFEGKAFIAGGFVRDSLLGKDSKDIDIVVELPDGGIDFANFITKKLNLRPPIIFPTYGTAKFDLKGVIYKGEDLSDQDIECVMTRKEQYHDGSRNPDVSPGTLKDDVDRRDFTVNSLLQDLSTGEILDLTGMGRDDLKRGIIRTPLDPNIIFKEDALRMLRAIRFTVKYNWDLPLFMIKAIKNNAPLLNTISAERIQVELDKMLISDKPDIAIRLLQITGLSKYMLPELDNLIGLEQNKFHKDSAMKHSLEVLKNTPPNLITRLQALFHDIGKFETKEIIDNDIHFYRHEELGGKLTREILTRLKYPNDIIDAVVKGVEEHMRIKSAGMEGDKISDKALRKLKRDLGDHIDSILDLMHADNISHSEEHSMPNQIPNIRKRLDTVGDVSLAQHMPLPVTGWDLMTTFGLKPGKQLGDLLKIVEDAVLENPDLTKQDALNIVKQNLNT